MIANSFVTACKTGDEKKARELYDSDKSVLNRQDDDGDIGLLRTRACVRALLY